MKKLFTFFLAIVATTALYAYDFQSGDLYYNITSSNEPYTVEITYQEYSFDNYASLISVTIPEYVTYNSTTYSVTGIGKLAFVACTGLISITIPNSITTIGDSAFYFSENLPSITIPNSVTSIGKRAFSACLSLTSVIWNANTHTDLEYDSEVFLESPVSSFVFGDSVEYVPANLCFNMSSLKSVTISNSVTNIGENAFRNTNNLTNLTIGNSVISIGDRAFKGCSKLKNMNILAEIPPSLGEWVFDLVPKYIPVYVPCGCVDAYNTGFWSDFSNFQEPMAEYSITVNTIDSRMGHAKVKYNTACGCQIEAFPKDNSHFVQWSDANTENPRTFTVTKDTLLVAEFAPNLSGQCGNTLYWSYNEDSQILSVTGAGGMYDYTTSTQPWLLFQNLMTALEIGDSVTSIGNSAFSGCSSLHSIIWNAKKCSDFSAFDKSPFYESHSQITSFAFGEGVEHIPAYLCYEMAELTNVTIPNTVISIGDYAFYGLNSRKFNSVILSNKLTSLGAHAFEGASYLKNIHFGYALEEIGEYAFKGCTRVTKMTCLAEITPNVSTDALADISSSAELYVPSDFLLEYQVDNNWNRFSIKTIGAENTIVTKNEVTVEPTDNAVTITWPTNEQASTYTIEITKDGVVFCSLVFNANGQLTSIAFARSYDGHSSAPAATAVTDALQFTVTGLDSGTRYAYKLDTKKNGQALASYSGQFTTKSNVSTSVSDIQSPITDCQKLLRNGQLVIVRDGVEYNAQGQIVKE